MKKVMLCIFSLIFILFAACTGVSFLVEDWMTPEVAVASARNRSDPETGINLATLPVDAVRYDSAGAYALRIQEEDGWNKGETVLREGLSELQYLSESEVGSRDLVAYGEYVRFSSKPIEPGQTVRRADNSKSGGSQTVLLRLADPSTAEGFPEALAALGFEVLGTGGDAFLVRSDALSVPFFEEEVKSVAASAGYFVASAYSMDDLTALGAALMPLACAGMLFCVALLLWGFFCRALYRGTAARYWIWAAIAAALAAAWAVLFFFMKLPSSLLPQRQILDVAHYRARVSEFLALLRAVGQTAAADAWEAQAAAAFWSFLAVSAALVAFFPIFCHLRRAPARGSAGRHTRPRSLPAKHKPNHAPKHLRTTRR